MNRGVLQLERPLDHPAAAGKYARGLCLDIIRLEPAYRRDAQRAVRLDPSHHRAKRVDMGAEQQPVARPAQLHG